MSLVMSGAMDVLNIRPTWHLALEAVAYQLCEQGMLMNDCKPMTGHQPTVLGTMVG